MVADYYVNVNGKQVLYSSLDSSLKQKLDQSGVTATETQRQTLQTVQTKQNFYEQDHVMVTKDNKVVSIPGRYAERVGIKYQEPQTKKMTAREKIEEKKRQREEKEEYYNVVTGEGKGAKKFESLTGNQKYDVLTKVDPISLAQQGILAPSENVFFKARDDGKHSQKVYSKTLEQNYKSYILTGDTSGINRYLQELYEKEGPRVAFRERERLIKMGIKGTGLEGARQAGGTGTRPQRIQKEAEQRRSARILESGQAKLHEAMFGTPVKGELGATFDTRFPTTWVVEGKEFTSKKEAEKYSEAFVGPRKIEPSKIESNKVNETITEYEVDGKTFKTLKEAEEYQKTQTKVSTETVPLFLLPNPVTQKDDRSQVKKDIEKAYKWLDIKSQDPVIKQSDTDRLITEFGKGAVGLAGSILNVAESVDTSIGNKVKDIRGWQGPSKPIQPIIFSSESADVIPIKAVLDKGLTPEAYKQFETESKDYIKKYGLKPYLAGVGTNFLGLEATPAIAKSAITGTAKLTSKVGMKVAATQTIKATDKLQNLKYALRVETKPDPIGIRMGKKPIIQKVKTYPEIAIQPQITAKQVEQASNIMKRTVSKQEMLERLKQPTTLDRITLKSTSAIKSKAPISFPVSSSKSVAATQKDVRLYIDPKQKKIADALRKTKSNTEQTIQELKHDIRGESVKVGAPVKGVYGPPPMKTKLTSLVDTDIPKTFTKETKVDLGTSVFGFTAKKGESLENIRGAILSGKRPAVTPRKQPAGWKNIEQVSDTDFGSFWKSAPNLEEYQLKLKPPVKAPEFINVKKGEEYFENVVKPTLAKEAENVQRDAFMKTAPKRRQREVLNLETVSTPDDYKLIQGPQKPKNKLAERFGEGKDYVVMDKIKFNKIEGWLKEEPNAKVSQAVEPDVWMKEPNTKGILGRYGSKPKTVAREGKLGKRIDALVGQQGVKGKIANKLFGKKTIDPKIPSKIDKEKLFDAYNPPEEPVPYNTWLPEKTYTKDFTRRASKTDLEKQIGVKDEVPMKRLGSTQGNVESIWKSPEGKPIIKDYKIPPKVDEESLLPKGFTPKEELKPTKIVPRFEFTKAQKASFNLLPKKGIERKYFTLPTKSKSPVNFGKKIETFSYTKQYELNKAVSKIKRIPEREPLIETPLTPKQKRMLEKSKAEQGLQDFQVKNVNETDTSKALDQIKRTILQRKQKTGMQMFPKSEASVIEIKDFQKPVSNREKIIKDMTKSDKGFSRQIAEAKAKRLELSLKRLRLSQGRLGGKTAKLPKQKKRIVDPSKVIDIKPKEPFTPTPQKQGPNKPKRFKTDEEITRETKKRGYKIENGQIVITKPPAPQDLVPISKSGILTPAKRPASIDKILPTKPKKEIKVPKIFTTPRQREKKKPQRADVIMETLYLHKDRPQPVTPKLSTTLFTERSLIRSILESKPKQVIVPKSMQRPYLSSKPKLFSSTKAAIKPLIKQKEKPILKTRTPQLEGFKQVEVPRLKTKTVQTPKLKSRTREIFPRYPTTKLVQEQPKRTAQRETYERPPIFPVFGTIPKFDVKPRKEKKKKKKKGKDTEEFLGSTWEQSVIGFRSKKFDITYKKKSISRLLGEERVKFKRTEFKPRGKSSLSKGKPKKLEDKYQEFNKKKNPWKSSKVRFF